MLGRLFKNLVSSRQSLQTDAAPVRLHIGGKVRVPGWHVLDVLPGEHVDFVGSCVDLSRFRESSVQEIYASHVLEHLSYWRELDHALAEFHRVLAPAGILRVSVPELTTLCRLILEPTFSEEERFHVMRMMFGGQVDGADFHHVGLTEQFMTTYLTRAGFSGIERVEDLGIFQDASRLVYKGVRISLNMTARKAAA